LNLWGTHPFKVIDPNSNPPSYKKIKTSVAFAGLQIGGVNDTTSTQHDVLVVIDPAINVASSVEYKLMNPKAWYCMKFQVTSGVEEIKADTNVKIHCDAKLAQSNLVLSADSTNNTGVVGINGDTIGYGTLTKPDSVAQGNIVIDGTVKVNRVNAAGGACN
jgi:hypothetical protein